VIRGEKERFLAVLAEMEPVVGRGRDQQRRRDGRAEQRPEKDSPLEVGCLGKALAEGHRQEECEQDLHPRQRHTQLVEELDQLAVDAL
jgi:hypothetical protein